jgi:hypothetical protein
MRLSYGLEAGFGVAMGRRDVMASMRLRSSLISSALGDFLCFGESSPVRRCSRLIVLMS